MLIDVCGVEEIPHTRAVVRCVAGERVAVFKYGNRVSAISNVCQHQNGPLGEGKIVNGCVVCPWHRYEYYPDSGASPPRFTEKVPTFTVVHGSERPLSGAATDPAQIGFTPDGDALVVTEKATNKIVTFQIGRHRLPGDGRVQDSNGPTPFGFAFGKRDQLFVSEAFGGAEHASATSSYDIDRDGELTTISASVGTKQTAACWVVVTPNGRFAYVTQYGQWLDLGIRDRLRWHTRPARR